MKKFLIFMLSIIGIISLIFILFVVRIKPWRLEKYVDQKLINVLIHKQLPNEKNYKNYYVNGSFISVFILAHNQTSKSGNGPYNIHINAWGNDNFHKVFRINKVTLKSSLEIKHVLFKDNELPRDIKFETDYLMKLHMEEGKATYKDVSTGMSKTRYKSENILFLDFDKREKLEVIIECEIETTDSVESGIIKFNFDPVLEKGILQYMQV